jgi:uncharacterized protein YndB with AHSA1/START domain
MNNKKSLDYSIDINASRESVWEKMIASDTYKIWTKAFSENSQYEGQWEEGTEMKFIDPSRGGTVVLLETVKLYEEIRAKHVAIIDANGNVQRSNEEFAKWIGTREDYLFSENSGVTTLQVHMEAHPDYMGMFESSWPQALKRLKELAETT